jgi:O-succinylbenzoic acid--CoA ligase
MEKGHLVVSGRKDSMFISGGENIQPEEIERALLEVTAAESVLVTPVPDAEYGHRPCAWLDLPEAQWQVDLWMPRLRERLPGYMLPVQWRELPPQNGLKLCRNAELKMGMDSPGAFA